MWLVLCTCVSEMVSFSLSCGDGGKSCTVFLPINASLSWHHLVSAFSVCKKLIVKGTRACTCSGSYVM